MVTLISPADVPARATWEPFNPTHLARHSSIFRSNLIPKKSSLAEHQTKSELDVTDLSNDHPFVVIKVVSTRVAPPHNVLNEIRTLSSLSHPNIVPLLTSFEQVDDCGYSHQQALVFPFYPLSLSDLLNSNEPRFDSSFLHFDKLVRHFFTSITKALEYLHSQSIGHRDLNPSNILIDHQATPILIDFGTVYNPIESEEKKDELEFELGTMPYRAPELLFGSRSYSPTAIDLWSLGVILIDFFRPIQPIIQTDPETTIMDQATLLNSLDFLLQVQGKISPVRFQRSSLFDGERGDIGLVGSIFKILGTPDFSTWPQSKDLPDFDKIKFIEYKPLPKDQFIELLPHCVTARDDLMTDLLFGLLVYDWEKRLSAKDILKHPCLKPVPENCKGSEKQSNYSEWIKPWIS